MFRPGARRFATQIRVRHRVDAVVNGAPYPTYEDAVPALHSCEFKPFFGAEAIRAGQIGVTEGGTITMWYVPGIKHSDRILLNDDQDLVYEVTSVENVENLGMYLILKVERVVSA